MYLYTAAYIKAVRRPKGFGPLVLSNRERIAGYRDSSIPRLEGVSRFLNALMLLCRIASADKTSTKMMKLLVLQKHVIHAYPGLSSIRIPVEDTKFICNYVIELNISLQ